jgi:hypothetical protein
LERSGPVPQSGRTPCTPCRQSSTLCGEVKAARRHQTGGALHELALAARVARTYRSRCCAEDAARGSGRAAGRDRSCWSKWAGARSSITSSGSTHGTAICRFVLCLGYRGAEIEDHFRRFADAARTGADVVLTDTGVNVGTGARLARAREHLGGSTSRYPSVCTPWVVTARCAGPCSSISRSASSTPVSGASWGSSPSRISGPGRAHGVHSTPRSVAAQGIGAGHITARRVIEQRLAVLMTHGSVIGTQK